MAARHFLGGLATARLVMQCSRDAVNHTAYIFPCWKRKPGTINPVANHNPEEIIWYIKEISVKQKKRL